jgi:hypothetical protein
MYGSRDRARPAVAPTATVLPLRVPKLASRGVPRSPIETAVHLLDAVHVLKLAGYITTPAVGDLRVGAFRAATRACRCGRTGLSYSRPVACAARSRGTPAYFRGGPLATCSRRLRWLRA